MKRKLKTLQELFNMLKKGNQTLEFPTDLKYGEWVDVKTTVHDKYVIGIGVEVFWVPESWFEPILTLPENCGRLVLTALSFSGTSNRFEISHEIKFSDEFIKYAQANIYNDHLYQMLLKPQVIK